MIWDFIKRKILRLSRDRWNHQYRSGQWSGLHGEDDRFAAVTRMLEQFNGKPAILEIGCGDAVLFQKLPPTAYSVFDGVDISDVAIQAARRFEKPHVTFTNGDMQVFTPRRQYDFIVFNESLYYARSPAATLKRYIPFLTRKGSFIVTAVANKYTISFWPALSQDFTIEQDEAVIREHRWDVRQLKAN
jgi:2-polyprenyl-6-hydroxyphenyl methylase/3-demethylubiquinone-9 3-methyltransferase